MIYRIINSWTIPTILFLIFVGIIFMLSKKSEKLVSNPVEQYSKKSRLLVIVVYLIIAVSILVFPYEKLFRFQTPQEILNYEYPFNKVIKTYDYKDYVYILYSDIWWNSLFSVHYVKKNGKWMSDDKFEKSVTFHDGCAGIISEVSDKNAIGVEIKCLINKEKSIVVEDSLNSKFDKYTKEEEGEFYLYDYFTVINRKLDDSYSIIINNKKYRINGCIKNRNKFCSVEK